MITKCAGCGASIQFTDKDKVGYINEEVYNKRLEEDKEILCERCFKLKHYNYVEKVTISHQGFLDLIKNNITNNMLICYIVDMFDLTGSMIPNLNELFPHNEILVIGNKYDLFMRSNRPTKLKKYLADYLKDNNINVIGTIITSGLDTLNAKKVYESILKIIDNDNLSKEVFFFGMSNSGKTTLLKSIGESIDNKNAEKLLVSKAISTTIGLNKIDLGDIVIVDSPGIVNEKQFTYYLNKKTIDLIMPKSVIKAKVFQLNENQKIFVEGFCDFSLIKSEENKTSVSFYVSSLLKLHRTKYFDNDDFLESHYNDLFKTPNKQERNKLGKRVKYTFNLNNDEMIAIAGLGFIEVNSNCVIEIKTFETIGVEKRKKMI